MWKEFALPPLSQLHGVDWRIGTYIIHDVGAEKMPKAPRTKFCRHVSKVWREGLTSWLVEHSESPVMVQSRVPAVNSSRISCLLGLVTNLQIFNSLLKRLVQTDSINSTTHKLLDSYDSHGLAGLWSGYMLMWSSESTPLCLIYSIWSCSVIAGNNCKMYAFWHLPICDRECSIMWTATITIYHLPPWDRHMVGHAGMCVNKVHIAEK